MTRIVAGIDFEHYPLALTFLARLRFETAEVRLMHVIESVLPTTIFVHFPMLTSGGYFVNGIGGVVYDPLTFTGFRAGGPGLAAILDNNLIITYGGSTLVLVPPTQILFVAMGDSIKPPEPEKDKDIFEDIKDDKKDAPICR